MARVRFPSGEMIFFGLGEKIFFSVLEGFFKFLITSTEFYDFFNAFSHFLAKFFHDLNFFLYSSVIQIFSSSNLIIRTLDISKLSINQS